MLQVNIIYDKTVRVLIDVKSNRKADHSDKHFMWLRMNSEDFSGSPVVKSPSFQCRECRFLVGELRSHIPQGTDREKQYVLWCQDVKFKSWLHYLWKLNNIQVTDITANKVIIETK